MIAFAARALVPWALVLVLPLYGGIAPAGAQASFTMEQLRSYPFPNELVAAPTGSKLAWAFNEQGRRNLWVAEGPDFPVQRG
jgi:hypothetical protein